jgi:hypothetical protein
VSGGEANTISGAEAEVDLIHSSGKQGVDLRLRDLATADFGVSLDIISINTNHADGTAHHVATPDEVGAVTATSVCQGDGAQVQCDIANLAQLNTAISSGLVTGAHTADEVGAVTATVMCQGDGAQVVCDVATLANLNTALGSSVADGAHVDDNVDTVNDNQICQGNVGSNIDCDIANLTNLNTALGASIADGIHFVPTADPDTDHTIIGGDGITVSAGTWATASSEENFIAGGLLVCGAGTQGKMQVHTSPLQYCDATATPVLRHAAYGDTTGDAVGVACSGAASLRGDGSCADPDSTNFAPSDNVIDDHINYVAGHGDGGDCVVGSYARGVDAAGVATPCVDASVEIDSIVATHDAIVDAHHNEAHVLATTGPHTGKLPDSDMEDMLAYTISLRNAGTTGARADVKITGLSDEPSPAALDFVMIERADGTLARADIGDLPSGGGGEINTISGQEAQVDLIHSSGKVAELHTQSHAYDSGADHSGTLADTNMEDMLAWTLSMRNAGTTGARADVKISALTDEPSPAALDFLMIERADGTLARADIGDLPGGGGGDNVSVDSVAVVDPDFQDGGDINFTDTSNVITATIKPDVVGPTELDETSAADYDFKGDIEMDGPISIGGQSVFAGGDTTPEVGGGAHFVTGTADVEMTDFDVVGGDNFGDIIWVETGAAVAPAEIKYDCSAATLDCNNGQMMTTYPGDVTVWIFEDEVSDGWRLVSYQPFDTTVQAKAQDLKVLYLSHPPGASGLVAMDGSGTQQATVGTDWKSFTDGDGGDAGDVTGSPGSADDMALVINPAITWACANGYDVVEIPDGAWRVGVHADATNAFASGISIATDDCPTGIHLRGESRDGTIIMPRLSAGGYILVTTNNHVGDADIRQWGIHDTGAEASNVTATSLASPPRVTISANTDMIDGDMVYVRNCQDSIELNDKTFIMSEVTPTTFDLLTPSGENAAAVAVAETTGSTCIIYPFYPDLKIKISDMTFMDDAPMAHLQFSDCVDGCDADSEETHGIYVHHNGGETEIFNMNIIGFGDEGIDCTIGDGACYFHDNYFEDNIHGSMTVGGGRGHRFINNHIVANSPLSTTDSTPDTGGTTTELEYGPNNVIQISTGQQSNSRIDGLLFENNVLEGIISNGISMRLHGEALSGAYVRNIKINQNVFNLDPLAGHCDQSPAEQCSAIDIRAAPCVDAFSSGGPPQDTGSPDDLCDFDGATSTEDDYGLMSNIQVKHNYIQGMIDTQGGKFTENIEIAHNTIRPFRNHLQQSGAILELHGTEFSYNDVADFQDLCVGFYSAEHPPVLIDFTTCDDVTNEDCDLGAGHGLEDGEGPVRLSTTGALPTGLTADTTDYWVFEGSSANEVTFSTNPYGRGEEAVVPLTSAGSGTHTLRLAHESINMQIIGNELDCMADSGTPVSGIGPHQVSTPQVARPSDHERLVIADNTITIGGDSYTDIGIEVSANWSNVKVTGNKIQMDEGQTRLGGISIAAGSATVSDNFIESYDGTCISMNSGSPLQGGAARETCTGADEHSRTTACGGPFSEPIIERNSCDGHANAGAEHGFRITNTPYAQINDNFIQNYGGRGMLIENTDGLGGYNKIDGNRMLKVATAANNRAIEFLCTTGCTSLTDNSFNQVTNNTMDIDGNTTGEFVRAVNLGHSIIADNNFINASSGGQDAVLLFTGSDFNVCTGNKIEDNGGNHAKINCGAAGSHVGVGCGTSSSAGTSSYCEDNILPDASTNLTRIGMLPKEATPATLTREASYVFDEDFFNASVGALRFHDGTQVT